MCIEFYYSGKECGFDLVMGLRILNKYVVSDLSKEITYHQPVTDDSNLG